MRRAAPLLIAALVTLAALAAPAAAAEIPSPESFLGRKPGEDRYLVPYPKIVEYLRALDAASGRVTVEDAGRTTNGNEMVIAILTSERNQAQLDQYREIARRLANPDGLSEAEARDLIARGKTIVLVSGSIHSSEVGATQMSIEFAHEVATTADPRMLQWLDDVILLLVPSINPDGQVLVIDWYNKYLGTEFEGGMMPWLYHPYTGHDDNRDYYMLTQKESRIVNDILYHRWWPQIYIDEHQMGSTGPRMFVPPETDPVAPEVPSLIFRGTTLIGSLMSLRLEEAGKTGVGHSMIFDSYWPGGTMNTAWFKNVVGLLTEMASVRIATPIRVEPGELSGGYKGLPEYGRRANYPSPWPGGDWRLRDIMDYEAIATRAVLEAASVHRTDFLTNFRRLNREGIERGKSEPPYGFVVPPDQHDTVAAARMIDLLLRHGVRVHRAAEPVRLGSAVYPAGSYVILASQPYRPFVLTMLQPQKFPEVLSDVGGSIIEPYDVTSWALPVAMGVETIAAAAPIQARLEKVEAVEWPGGAVAAAAGGWLIPHSADSAFAAMNRVLGEKKAVYWLEEPPRGGAAGDIYIPAGELSAEAIASLASDLHVPVRSLEAKPTGRAWKVKPVRVGLYKPWVASMDEGWTRWLLEQHGFTYVTLTNEDMKKGEFARKADVLLLPDVGKSVLKEGKPPEEHRRWFSPMPPEYTGGVEKEGGDQIKKWVTEEGGTVVALDSSADYLIELLDLPITNVLEKVEPSKFACPGAMLRILVDTALPIAYGMRPVEGGYFDDSPAFQTRPPDARFDRRVVASYPGEADEILVSGYIKGAEILEGRAAVVDLKVRKGRVVLIGFHAQQRAQTHRTFKILFNALYLPGLHEENL